MTNTETIWLTDYHWRPRWGKSLEISRMIRSGMTVNQLQQKTIKHFEAQKDFSPPKRRTIWGKRAVQVLERMVRHGAAIVKKDGRKRMSPKPGPGAASRGARKSLRRPA